MDVSRVLEILADGDARGMLGKLMSFAAETSEFDLESMQSLLGSMDRSEFIGLLENIKGIVDEMIESLVAEPGAAAGVPVTAFENTTGLREAVLPLQNDAPGLQQHCGGCDWFEAAAGTVGLGDCIGEGSPCKGGRVSKGQVACPQFDCGSNTA